MSAIGPKRTSLVAPHMSAFGGKADMATYSASSKSGKAGVGLFLTGKILGHLRNSTTERYAHLADDPVRQANDVIGRRIHDVLSSPVTDPEKIAHKKVPVKRRWTKRIGTVPSRRETPESIAIRGRPIADPNVFGMLSCPHHRPYTEMCASGPFSVSNERRTGEEMRFCSRSSGKQSARCASVG